MLKKIAFAFGILLAATGARAESYYELRCSSVGQHINWSEHLVGWLNLENIDAGGRLLNLEKSERDAAALRQTCANFSTLTLLQAVALTFPELDDLGLRLAATSSLSGSREYSYFKCVDMAGNPDWSAHLVGWLDLDHAASRNRELNFVKALSDAGTLRRTCDNFPNFWVHQAVEAAFPQIDTGDIPTAATGSIDGSTIGPRGKRASAE